MKMQFLTPLVASYAQVQTVKTLCALKCDVNKTATEEDIAGGATEADPARECLQPFCQALWSLPT